MKAKASFTIETAYIMGGILLGLVMVIAFAYKLHGRVIAEYISHYSVEQASHLEEIYRDEDINEDTIQAEGNYRLNTIGILKDSNLQIENDVFDSKVNTNIYREKYMIEEKKYNPERFIRAITVAQTVMEKLQDTGGEDEAGDE